MGCFVFKGIEQFLLKASIYFIINAYGLKKVSGLEQILLKETVNSGDNDIVNIIRVGEFIVLFCLSGEEMLPSFLSKLDLLRI